MDNIFEHYLMGDYLYTQTMMPVCEKYGINFTELTVVMFLANNPSLDTSSDIVKCRKLAKSHVSISVRSLEEMGLITKMYRDGNHRSVHLKLTEKADQIVSDGKAAQKHFGEIIFDGVTEIEKNTMLNILDKIDKNLEKHAKGERKSYAG